MRKFGAIFVALSLVATTPSYSHPVERKKMKQQFGPKTKSETDQSSLFTGLKKRVLFIDNSKPNGNGSFLCPYNNLEEALANSCGNDILYIMATEIPYTILSTLNLQNGQALIGSCMRLKLDNKEIPALTPDCEPKLLLNCLDGPAIAVSNCNLIAGLTITGIADPCQGVLGVGIGSNKKTLGAGNWCEITKNHFQTLETSIEATVQSYSRIDITQNLFSEVKRGIELKLGDAATVNIQKNRFEDSGESIDCQSLTAGCANMEPMSKSADLYKLMESIKVSNCSTIETDCLCSHGFNLCIDDNYFENGSVAIGSKGAEKAEICKNTVFGFQFGLFIESCQKAHIAENSFRGFEEGNVLMVIENGMIKDNLFEGKPGENRRAETGLNVLVLGQGTICGEDNIFSKNTCGLAIGNASAEQEICTHFSYNEGIDNHADFLFVNFADAAPLFKVIAPNPIAGKKTFSQANNKASVLICDSTKRPNNDIVSYREFCPVCDRP